MRLFFENLPVSGGFPAIYAPGGISGSAFSLLPFPPPRLASSHGHPAKVEKGGGEKRLQPFIPTGRRYQPPVCVLPGASKQFRKFRIARYVLVEGVDSQGHRRVVHVCEERAQEGHYLPPGELRRVQRLLIRACQVNFQGGLKGIPQRVV